MKNKLKLVCTLAILMLLFVSLCIVGYAEGDEYSDAAFVELGYDFHEEDPTVPKYKLVYADGTEKISYDSRMLWYDISGRAGDTELGIEPIDPAPTHTTVVLLSDIYYPNDAEAIPGTLVSVTGGKTINFDFNGYSIMNVYKGTAFKAEGSGAVVNAYSSRPGAELIQLTENGVGSNPKGGVIANASSGGVVNVGAFGDYPGSNLYTYSGGACNVYSGSTINFMGIDMYRMVDDHTAFFATRSNTGRLNLDGTRAFGVVRDLQFRVGSSGTSKTIDSVITVKNSYIINLGNSDDEGNATTTTIGPLFRFLSDGNRISFENTGFTGVSFSEDTKNTYTSKTMPVVFMDKYCSYNMNSGNKMPNVNGISTVFKFPELDTSRDAPEAIYVNGVCEDVKYFTLTVVSDKVTALNYKIRPHLGTISAYKCLPYLGYEDNTVPITWEYNASTVKQLWCVGEVPHPHDVMSSKEMKNLNPYVSLAVDNPYPLTPDDADQIYTISAKLNMDLYYNLVFGEDMTVNLYVPVLDEGSVTSVFKKITVGGASFDAAAFEEAELVKIDGQKFYKLVSRIDYSRISDTVVINCDIYGKSGTGAVVSTVKSRIRLPIIFEDLLNGKDADTLSPEIKKALEVIVDARGAESTAIAGLVSLKNIRFPSEE